MISDKGPRVYIPNRGSGHDYSSAREYGELIFVTTGSVNPYNTGKIYRDWNRALQESSPDDSIVLTSLNVLCSVGAAVFASKHNCLNLLIYSNRGKYKHRRILIDGE